MRFGSKQWHSRVGLALAFFLLGLGGCETGGVDGPVPEAGELASGDNRMAINQDVLVEAEVLGRALFLRESAAVIAGRFLEGEGFGTGDLRELGWAGRIVEPVEGGTAVTWVKSTDAGLIAATTLFVPNATGEARVVDTSQPPLNRRQAARFRAQLLARELAGGVCTGNVVTLALENPTAGGFYGYALVQPDDPARLQAGGHLRVLTSPDGRTVVSHGTLHAGCATVGREPAMLAGNQEDGYRLVLPGAAQPNEAHVYLQLLTGRPWHIETPASGTFWRLADGRIEELPPSYRATRG